MPEHESPSLVRRGNFLLVRDCHRLEPASVAITRPRARVYLSTYAGLFSQTCHESTAKAVLLSRAGFGYHIPALYLHHRPDTISISVGYAVTLSQCNAVTFRRAFDIPPANKS
jgi:hypothetical protein